jgi:hypothetical protein
MSFKAALEKTALIAIVVAYLVLLATTPTG